MPGRAQGCCGRAHPAPQGAAAGGLWGWKGLTSPGCGCVHVCTSAQAFRCVCVFTGTICVPMCVYMCVPVPTCGSPARHIPWQGAEQGQVTWGTRTPPWSSQPCPGCDTAAGDTLWGAVGSLWMNPSISPSVPSVIGWVPSITCPRSSYHPHWCPLHHFPGPLHHSGATAAPGPAGSRPVPKSSAAGAVGPSPGARSHCTARPGPPSRRSPEDPGAGKTGAWGLWSVREVLGLCPTPWLSVCVPAVLPGAVLARSLPADPEAPAGATGRGALCMLMCVPTSLPKALCTPWLSPRDAAPTIVPTLGTGTWRGIAVGLP